MKVRLIFFLLVGMVVWWGCSKEDADTNENQATETTVVINELMPKNSETVADQDGEFDDWIELYNTTASAINLTGYFLSDSKKNTTKWSFPGGTTIGAHSYLIIWADGDTLQAGLHTNFKLAADGEKVVLSNPDVEIMDQVEYDAQSSELSFARVPDGTGGFTWRTPTYGVTNGAYAK